jgi:hypothetical protein
MRLVLPLLGGSVVCGALTAGEPERLSSRTYPWTLNHKARASLVSIFAQQAQNGEALEQTMWNDYFLRTKGELHAAGQLVLDRLARRQLDQGPGTPIIILVGRTKDLPPETKPEDLLRVRDQIDRERLLAVQAYLAANWPQVEYVLATNDPARVGATATEAVLSLIKTREITQGYIPDTLIGGGLQAALSGATTRGTTAGAAVVPGKAGASAYGSGADAGGGATAASGAGGSGGGTGD